jgi:ribosomal protein S18 acetylase RimI-like enzyme
VDYIFVLAQEADAPAVFALYRGMIGTPGCTWSDVYPTEEIVLRDIRTGSLYVLRDARGQIIAAAAAGPDDELRDLPWNMRNPCELARVAVALPLQNRGVGSRLLQHVIPAVKARGFDGIRMLVSIGNFSALALYDKNGFTRLDEVHMYGHDFYRYQIMFGK